MSENDLALLGERRLVEKTTGYFTDNPDRLRRAAEYLAALPVREEVTEA